MKISAIKIKISRTGGIFLFALVCNALIWGGYFYLWGGIRAKSEHLATLAAAIADQNGQKEYLSSAKSKALATASERDKLDSYLIPKDGVVPFLNLVQALGVQNSTDLKVLSVDIDQNGAPAIFETVKINLEATGIWDDVHRLAALFESMPLRISVGRINFQKRAVAISDAKGGGGLWTLGMEFSVLKLK